MEMELNTVYAMMKKENQREGIVDDVGGPVNCRVVEGSCGDILLSSRFISGQIDLAHLTVYGVYDRCQNSDGHKRQNNMEINLMWLDCLDFLILP